MGIKLSTLLKKTVILIGKFPVKTYGFQPFFSKTGYRNFYAYSLLAFAGQNRNVIPKSALPEITAPGLYFEAQSLS